MTDPATAEHEHKSIAPSVSVEEAGPARKRLTIEVPWDQIEHQLEHKFDHIKREAQIPGFRVGRAPRRLVERRFGKAVRDEVRSEVLNQAYRQAIVENDLRLVGEPEIKNEGELELTENQPLRFEMEVEVEPTFELPSLEGISVEKPSAEVGDEEIEQEIERVRERMGSTQAHEDVEIEANDFVAGHAWILAGEDTGDDAEVIQDLPDTSVYVPGESRQYKGHIGGVLIDDLGHRMLGQKPGTQLRMSMTGPSSHDDERVRDQPITIVFDMQNVQRLEPASMEQVLEQVGMESEQNLRDRVREMLEQQKEQQQREQMQEQIRNYLLENTEMELPEGMVQRHAERLVDRQRQQFAMYGLDESTIEQQLEQARSESDENARREIKLHFLLRRAGEQLELEVSEGELNSQISHMARQQGARPEQLRQQLQQNDEIEAVRAQALEQKTFDKLLEKAEVREASGESGGETETAASSASNGSDDQAAGA